MFFLPDRLYNMSLSEQNVCFSKSDLLSTSFPLCKPFNNCLYCPVRVCESQNRNIQPKNYLGLCVQPPQGLCFYAAEVISSLSREVKLKSRLLSNLSPYYLLRLWWNRHISRGGHNLRVFPSSLFIY